MTTDWGDLLFKMGCFVLMYSLSMLYLFIAVAEPDFELSRSHTWYAGIALGATLTMTYFFVKDLLRRDANGLD